MTTKRRLLSLDGGGIRCLIAIEQLVALEQRLAERSGRPELRLCDSFDLVAGTSAGAIIATAIALGIPMVEIRDFVVANARNMFARARWYQWSRSLYDKSELQNNMMHWFGAETTLGSEQLKCLLLVVMRNWSTDSPWIVSNNPSAPFNDKSLDDCNLNLPLWQLARASAAAPIYYRPERIQFGTREPYQFIFDDGGLTGFLNPAFKAFQFVTTEAYGLNWPTSEDTMSLISIGAGDSRHHRPKKTLRDINIWNSLLGFPSAMLQATVREQDLLCRTFGRCITGNPIDLEIGDMKQSRTAVEPRLFRYHRLNPVLTEEGLKGIGCSEIRPKDVVKIDAVDQVRAFLEIGRAMSELELDKVIELEFAPTSLSAG